MENSEEQLLKPDEVASFLQVSQKTIRRMGKDGRLTVLRINKQGHRRFLKSDIEKFLGIQKK